MLMTASMQRCARRRRSRPPRTTSCRSRLRLSVEGARGMIELPWSKREIIDAMIAEFRQFDFDDQNTWAFYSQVRALGRLASSDRAPPGFCAGLGDRLANKDAISPLEDAVFARLGRVYQALRDGRDPDAAYEVPLRG